MNANNIDQPSNYYYTCNHRRNKERRRMSYNETLPCDATAVEATDPVAWGLISMFVTGVCVIYNYGFWATTIKKVWAPTNKTYWDNKWSFYGWDIVFLNFIFYLAAIGMVGLGLGNYINQNNNRYTIRFGLLSPQDVTNVVYLFLSMMVLSYHKFYQLYQGATEMGTTEGKIEYNGKIGKNDLFFAISVPVSALMTMCLFGGAYGFLQAETPISTCNGTAVTRFEYDQSNPNLYASHVAWAHVATGVFLAVSLGGHFTMPAYNIDQLRTAPDRFTSYSKMVSYQWNIFDVINSPSQKRSVVVGWLPTLHLGFWWTIAFSWFFAQSHIYTHYDFYKVLGIWFCTSFLSLLLSCYSGSMDCFAAYFFASVFTFELIQYLAGAFLQPVEPSTLLTQPTINYGVFLTGPASVANMDVTTVTAFTYIGLVLSLMAFAVEYARWKFTTVN